MQIRSAGGEPCWISGHLPAPSEMQFGGHKFTAFREGAPRLGEGGLEHDGTINSGSSRFDSSFV